jgi:hypothetical protein
MKALLAGAAGGMAPFIITLGKTLTTLSPKEHFVDAISPWYFLGVILFAVLGLGIVFFFSEPDIKKSFVLGISAPALISSFLASPAGSTQMPQASTTTEHAGIASLSVSSGFRFVVLPVADAQTREVNVSNQSSLVITANFYDQQANLVTSFNVSSQTSSVLAVPSRATNVRFRAGNTQTGAYPLGSDGSTHVSFQVTASGTRNFGFFQGLGAPAEVQYQIEVKQGEGV